MTSIPSYWVTLTFQPPQGATNKLCQNCRFMSNITNVVLDQWLWGVYFTGVDNQNTIPDSWWLQKSIEVRISLICGYWIFPSAKSLALCLSRCKPGDTTKSLDVFRAWIFSHPTIILSSQRETLLTRQLPSYPLSPYSPPRCVR